MAELAADLRKTQAHRIRGLAEKLTFPWLRDVCLDWAILILTFTILAVIKSPLLALPALLIIGNRQHALAVLGHEGAHLTLSSNKRANDWLANLLAFWPIGLTIDGYRALHYGHHKFSGTANDPELHHKKSRSPQWDLPLQKRKVAKYLLQDLLGFSISDYLIIVTFSKPEKKRDHLLVIAFHAVASGMLVGFGFWYVAALWYVSLLTSFMMFFRLRLWIEHQGTPETHRISLNWWQRHVLAPHNIWYHWEHHKYSAIPYYNLPKVRALDTSVPILTLEDLVRKLQSSPAIASGEALKDMI